MRLSKKEIQTILHVAKEIYGNGVEVYLFGSRVNDEKKGVDTELIRAQGYFGPCPDARPLEIFIG